MKPRLSFLLIGLALMCAPAAGLAAETIHPDTVAPAERYNDAPNWELGTVFRTTAPGKITHARVFSLADESGEHLVTIWRNADNTVIAGPIPWTFGGDEAWIALDIPEVSVEPNTDYTISVSVAADGWYPANSQYFAAAGDNGAHLAYPPAAGVFSDTLGNRPTQSYGNASYLRDVVFEPEGAFPAIQVLGNGVRITPGASAPNLTDGTQFGGVNVGAGPVARTFTIANPGSASLGLTGTPLVALGGAQVGDFSVTAFPAATVPPGGSTTFTVQFTPAASGLRDATVTLTNNAGAPYQFAVEGIGMGDDFRLLGNRTATRVLTMAPDQIIGSRFMAMRNMRLSQINLQVARLTSSAGNAVLKCAIYADGGGSSGRLLGTTSELIGPASGWQALPLTSPVDVSAASNYWLVAWASGEQIQLYGDATGRLQWGAYPYGGDWPDPVDLATGSSANTFCLYAEGIPTDKTGPGMEVQGNGWYVPAGSTNTTSADGTDFGAAMLYGGTRVSTFTILNVGQGSLALSGAPAATVVGPHASDFTVTTQPNASVPAGGSSALTIRFTPSAAGPRMATVVIPHADSPTAYEFAVRGTGLNPPGAGVLGLDGIGVDSRPNDSYYIIGNRFMAPGDLRITELHAKVVAMAGSFTCAVYADDNGLSGALLGSTIPTSSPTNGWNTFPLIAPLTVKGGDYYWLMIWADDPAAALQNDPVGTAYVGNYAYAGLGGAWPDPILLNPITWEARTVCIYAEGTPVTSAPGPQLNLRGNGKLIVAGDTSPSALDGTDFGSLAVGTGTLDYTFTIQNPGSTALQLTGTPAVAVTGPQAGDFLVTSPPTSPVAPGGSTTFTMRFAPLAAGLRSATVSIANNDLASEKNPYTFTVRGAGLFVGRETIFPDSKVGADVDNDGTAYALGTIFQPSVAGVVTQLRVFSVAGDYGDHRAWLWRNSDQTPVGGPYVWNFGGVTGWIYFDIPPVSLDAETDYTVSISTGTGPMRDYANIAADVGDGGSNGAHLSYPPNAGVFLENNLDAMPFKTWNASSYLRDVVFVPSTSSTPLPAMAVLGNGLLIPDGYSSPNAANATHFGLGTVGGAGVERAFTVTNAGPGTLHLIGSPRVALTGAQAGDFMVVTQPAASVGPAGAVSFTLRFSPTAAGVRRALVTIENNDKNPYYFAIAGTGDASLPPRITSITADRNTGQVTLRWNGTAAQYQVERATNVSGPYAPVAPAQSANAFTDPGALSRPQSYYRVRAL